MIMGTSCYKSFQIAIQSRRLLTDSCNEIKHVKCWNCENLLDCLRDKFFCTSCTKIQPPVKCANYFQYLEFPIQFDIDNTQLSNKHKSLQRVLHPDKFSRASEKELELAGEQSAVINKAFFTLQKPLSRARYMLDIMGAPLNESESSVDSEFLMKMMELNEAVAETTNKDEIKKLKMKNAKEINALVETLSKCFAKKDLQKAKETTARLQYHASLEDQIHKRMGYG